MTELLVHSYVHIPLTMLNNLAMTALLFLLLVLYLGRVWFGCP